MPPKNVLSFNPTKLYIQNGIGEWVELGKVQENPMLEPIEKGINTTTCPRFEKIKLSGTISWRSSSRKRFLQELGLLKRPRLTYKTNMDYINKRRYNGNKRQKK